MKRILFGLLAWALAASAAFAQVNTVPQVGTISAFQKQYSYSATSVGLVPAASATDIYCISAGASRNISIKKIEISGTAGTAITTPFLVYRRSALGTAGTAATSLALPVVAPMNPGDPASSATLIAYTANPTVAATPTLMDVIQPTLAVTTTANPGTVAGVYGEFVSPFYHGLIIPKGSTQQICVNLNGVSVSSGVVNITTYWTEQ